MTDVSRYDDERILEMTKEFVTSLFIRRNCTDLLYHNLAHTQAVVDHSIEIAGHYPLTSKELFCLVLAAWFHDTGQLFEEFKKHEEAGADLMASFLAPLHVPEHTLGIISKCILATKMPTNPHSLIEKIICDADSYHLGTDLFWEMDKKVWAELKLRFPLSVEDPIQKTILFLSHHVYYTDYCQNLLNPGKEKNMKELRDRLTQ